MRLLFALLAALLMPQAVLSEKVSEPPCVSRSFEGSPFTICPFDSQTMQFRLVRTDAQGAPLRNFARLRAFLGPRAVRVRFAMNAGMFDAGGAPIGLYVEDGVTRHALNMESGAGNFYMKPNGVFFVDSNGTVGIAPTENFAVRRTRPRWATQSGPLLVTNGVLNPKISPDGTSLYIRNAVGIHDRHTAFFAISDEPVSFGRLARFLRDAQGCRNVLYLDGAVSSLWVPSQARRDDRAPLGPMLVVSDK